MTGREPAAPTPACCWLSPALPVALKDNIRWLPLTQILSWLKKEYSADSAMHICPETIYRALLLRNGEGLDKRFALKLRTGRRIRKTRWQ